MVVGGNKNATDQFHTAAQHSTAAVCHLNRGVRMPVYVPRGSHVALLCCRGARNVTMLNMQPT